MVLWLIGISGAGKSTLAELLRAYYEKKHEYIYIIDGDIVRNFFDQDLGYSETDRRANIKRILLASYVLGENGVNTIVANISPFEDLRQFARRKIPGYIQVYLKKDLEISISRDVKGVYEKNMGKTELVGREIFFENPKDNDLILDVNNLTPEESVNKILDFLREKKNVR